MEINLKHFNEKNAIGGLSKLFNKMDWVERPLMALQFVLYLADGPKTRDQMIDLFWGDQADYAQNRFKHKAYRNEEKRKERFKEVDEEIEKSAFERLSPPGKSADFYKVYKTGSIVFETELVKDSEVAAYTKINDEIRSKKKAVRIKVDPLPSNLSKVAKSLHRKGLIRIVYRHPKHDSPLTEKGNLRPGVRVLYLLRDRVKHDLAHWMMLCFLSEDGIPKHLYEYDTRNYHGEFCIRDRHPETDKYHMDGVKWFALKPPTKEKKKGVLLRSKPQRIKKGEEIRVFKE